MCVAQEEEKNKIQNDLRILTERLSRINESLARKVRAGSRPLRIALPCSANGRGADHSRNVVMVQIASRNEYDKTIAETEAAYMKILESSQTLLHVLKRETVNLTKKKQSSS